MGDNGYRSSGLAKADFWAATRVAVILAPMNRYEQWWPKTVQQAVDVLQAAGTSLLGEATVPARPNSISLGWFCRERLTPLPQTLPPLLFRHRRP